MRRPVLGHCQVEGDANEIGLIGSEERVRIVDHDEPVRQPRHARGASLQRRRGGSRGDVDRGQGDDVVDAVDPNRKHAIAGADEDKSVGEVDSPRGAAEEAAPVDHGHGSAAKVDKSLNGGGYPWERCELHRRLDLLNLFDAERETLSADLGDEQCDGCFSVFRDARLYQKGTPSGRSRHQPVADPSNGLEPARSERVDLDLAP